MISKHLYSASGLAVRVYDSIHSVPPIKGAPRNILEEAARTDDLSVAMRIVSDALELETLRLAEANLSEERRWRRLPVDARLKEIAGWMVAECHEVMDLVDITGKTPMDLVQTND